METLCWLYELIVVTRDLVDPAPPAPDGLVQPAQVELEAEERTEPFQQPERGGRVRRRRDVVGDRGSQRHRRHARRVARVVKHPDRSEAGLFLQQGVKDNHAAALLGEVIEVARTKPKAETTPLDDDDDDDDERDVDALGENVSGVAQAAQTTAAAVTESQAATEDLARMSADLQRLVGQFKV